MPVGPNTAFVLLMFGTAGIYCELIWPGRVIPGVAGAAAAATGAYFLFRPPLETAGLVLVAGGAAFLIGEACGGPNFILGTLGTIGLAAGFPLLLAPPRQIAPALAIPVSVLFGLLTALLASGAKRARRNKWADLDREK